MTLRQLSFFDDALTAPMLTESLRPDFIYTLTLWQPWASLIALRLKEVETRSWQRSYRGLIAIHAAEKPFKRWRFQGKEWHHFNLWLDRCVARHQIDLDSLPYKQVIAVADLTDIQPVQAIRDTLSVQELAFGDYRTDVEQRYGWVLENIRQLANPVEIAASNRTLWRWYPTSDQWAMINALRAE